MTEANYEDIKDLSAELMAAYTLRANSVDTIATKVEEKLIKDHGCPERLLTINRLESGPEGGTPASFFYTDLRILQIIREGVAQLEADVKWKFNLPDENGSITLTAGDETVTYQTQSQEELLSAIDEVAEKTLSLITSALNEHRQTGSDKHGYVRIIKAPFVGSFSIA